MCEGDKGNRAGAGAGAGVWAKGWLELMPTFIFPAAMRATKRRT